MSESSLVPERQLVFSPGLAATVGLEEAILLQHLQALFEHRVPRLRGGHAWLEVEREYLLRSLPFWQPVDLHRITRSLVEKGVLLVESPPLHSAQSLLFALNEPAARQASPGATAAAQPAPPERRGAHLLPAHWSPSEDMLQLLGLNHSIPRGFALEQLEDFVLYWRERGETSHAWENKFRQHVMDRWRRREQREAEAFRVPADAPLGRDWRPSEDAMDILRRDGVDAEFIDGAVPEFVLYWRERGVAPQALNTKFIQHIRLQWARYSSNLEHHTVPQRIPERWLPKEDVYDILRMCHIDTDFARAQLPEFIVYWRDSNQVHASWNSKFLHHVKYQWAKRHQLDRAGQNDGQQQGHSAEGRTRDRSLEQDLSDTSWAD